MSTVKPDAKPTLGFFTVVQDVQYGLCGGYLILNTSGRPLEFHCTAPFKPNRAQEILYGPTLDTFLYGEQIGQTLIRQGKSLPVLVCTDREPALATREYVPVPLVLVLPAEGETENATCPPSAADEIAAASKKVWRIDAPHKGGPRLKIFELGRNRLALPDRADEDRRAVVECLSGLSDAFDLSEPFQRIRDAIVEAQQAAR